MKMDKLEIVFRAVWKPPEGELDGDWLELFQKINEIYEEEKVKPSEENMQDLKDIVLPRD